MAHDVSTVLGTPSASPIEMVAGGPSDDTVTSSSPACEAVKLIPDEAPPTGIVPVNVWDVRETEGVLGLLLLSHAAAKHATNARNTGSTHRMEPPRAPKIYGT